VGEDGNESGLRRAWASIGSGRGLALVAVELWMVDAGFVHPVRTAKTEHRNRPLVLVRLHGRAGGSPIEGWGECAALADPTYDDEDASVAFATLEQWLVPALMAASAASAASVGPARPGPTVTAGAGAPLPRPSDLDPVRQAAPGAPLAFAALEMAVADAHLRAEGRSLAGVLGVEGRPVPIGAVVGQFGSVGSLVDEAVKLADQGFARLKMKIGPGWDFEALEAVTRAVPSLRLQADANGSYTGSDIGHLTGIDRFRLLCLEQPFGRRDLDSHRRLAERMTTPICLDESIDSPDAARRALAMGACSVVCVKPARLGGLGAALDLVQSCTDAGVPLWMGGMFESGYARGVNATLAALPGFAWAGDLSPPGSYLEVDPAPGGPPGRSGVDGALCVLPPARPGLGTPPDLRILEDRGLDRCRLELDGR
jgi:O-succinylbenzoate synthase